MRLALVFVVASVGTAVAQPAPAPCAVNIARAPDDVREVVEGWVRGEAHCHGDLEVRIVPTDGGLYLFARDAAGRVRERVVPDAQSAGVLVASWAADDGVVTPAPAPAWQPSSPPATVPTVEVEAASPSHGHIMLGLGAMLGSVYGVRADLDTARYGRLVFGLSVGISAAQLDADTGPLTMRDMNALVYAGLVLQHGRFWLRPQLGVGAITSEFNTFLGGSSMESTGGDSAALVEVSLRVGADLGSWTGSAGPVARYYRETWDLNSYGMLLQRDGDISFMISVGRRL